MTNPIDTQILDLNRPGADCSGDGPYRLRYACIRHHRPTLGQKHEHVGMD